MKKLLLVLGLALFLSPSADAYQCVRSQSIDKTDQCVASIRVASDETTLVSEGHVLVYDLSQSTNELKSFVTELADASAEDVLVAGIATGSITSNNISNVIVRGKTKVRVTGLAAVGDPLYVTTTEGNLGNIASTNSLPVGFALEAADDSTIDAYITIV